MKRSYNYQRVKSNRPYTLASLSELLEVHPATIRGWIRHDGLASAVIDGARPLILSGKQVKAWIKAREEKKRRPCNPDEMFCVKCKAPKKIRRGSFKVEPSNTEKITVTGSCKTCDMTLHQFNIAANLHEIIARFAPDEVQD